MKENNLQIVNEFYSKCLNQKQDINDKINEIFNGVHQVNIIDKVKTKIVEKMENFGESLRLMERLINDINQSEQIIWKK